MVLAHVFCNSPDTCTSVAKGKGWLTFVFLGYAFDLDHVSGASMLDKIGRM